MFYFFLDKNLHKVTLDYSLHYRFVQSDIGFVIPTKGGISLIEYRK